MTCAASCLPCVARIARHARRLLARPPRPRDPEPDPDGRPGPGQRDRRARGGHPRRPGGRRRVRAHRARPSTARSPSPPSTILASLAFLRDAWADTVAAGIPHGFLVPETIDNALMTEGMSDAVRRDPQHIAGRSGYRALDTSTPIVEGTYAASRAAVDVALTAVDLVLGGDQAAYGLCRPPGHHASRSMYGGYCYFNNAAIAAEAIARADRRARRDPRRRLPPRQRHRADLLAPRRRAVRVAPRPPRPRVPVLPRLAGRDGRGSRARAPTSTSRCRRDDERAVSRGPRPRHSSASRTTADRRSSSRSASTPTGSTRWATSR